MCILLAQKEGSECAGIRYLESGGVMKFKSTEHKELGERLLTLKR